MKLICSALFAVLICSSSSAQKRGLDSSIFGKWPGVSSPSISNDGHFAIYKIVNYPIGSHTVIFKGIQSNWKKEFCGVNDFEISNDSHKGIFINSNDSLGILQLGSDSIEYVSNVSSYKFIAYHSRQWLIYLVKNLKNECVIRELTVGTMKQYSGVKSFTLSNDGRNIVLYGGLGKVNDFNDNFLRLIGLEDGSDVIIWNGSDVREIIFDPNGTQLAFTNDRITAGRSTLSVWYYKLGMESAIMLFDSKQAEIDSAVYFDHIDKFSSDGTQIFFQFKKSNQSASNPGVVKLDVWNYKDAKLQSEQLVNSDSSFYANTLVSYYLGVYCLSSSRILRLQGESESVIADYDSVFIIKKKSIIQIGNSDFSGISEFYRVSSRDGIRRELPQNLLNLSLKGQFAIYFKDKSFFSYSLITAQTRNICPGKGYMWTYDNPLESSVPIGVAGWTSDESDVLVYDKYDIWLLDLSGKKIPVNLTNGFGRQHHIVLRLGLSEYAEKGIDKSDIVLLCAFNENNKNNGFYEIDFRKRSNPRLLSMGPYLYCVVNVFSFYPIKARDNNVYIVQRMSASNSPNFFTTTDFKSFVELSSIYPEREFNWLTSELVRWQTFDKSFSQGVLYKPENFDSTKKYPIIFEFYEKFSDELNLYHPPDASMDRINIPWFVSHGYLVFTPDIYYKIGKIGQSAVNSVVSSAIYLSHKPWVNKFRMGIQGHSFGGYEANFIVTQSHIFAAACSAAGISDCVSDYGSLTGYGNSRQGGYENGHEAMGGNLWMYPKRFIQNSPIFYVDKITTPILLMGNKGDVEIPFSQSIEFFMALRRLRKSAWLLQYDGENHSVFGKAALDYTVRLTQFFDHYLMGALSPKWMTDGIPSEKKGIYLGYDIDVK